MRVHTPAERKRRVRLLLWLRKRREGTPDAETVIAELRERFGIKEEGCDCPPCPGKGLDGNGMNHCAECCWGSRVVADIDCPIHGKAAYS